MSGQTEANDDMLTIRTALEGDTSVLDVGGEIDVHTAPQVEAAVRRAVTDDRPHVVLDLAEVTFIDSSGLRSLITLDREAQERSSRLVLRRASRPVDRLLEVTGLTSVFEIR